VGTWNTTSEFDRLTVNGRRLDPATWKVISGDFGVTDGKYIQSDGRATPAMSISQETFSGESITFAVRARKRGGAEGFLLRFAADKEGKGGYWWNVAGWNNTRHGLEQFTGSRQATVASRPGSIATGQWYDLKVELAAGLIRCYLDNALIQEYKTDPPGLSVASTYDHAVGEVIMKLVNPTPEPHAAHIKLAGVSSVQPKAQLISLSGERDASNTFDRPNTVVPVRSEIPAAAEFAHTIPAFAVQIIRVKVAGDKANRAAGNRTGRGSDLDR
jgi:alpha-L-arabinofuranosidase